MNEFLIYGKAFVVGGLICCVGQALLMYTRLTSARILVGYVTAGVILGRGVDGAGRIQAAGRLRGRGRDGAADRLRLFAGYGRA